MTANAINTNKLGHVTNEGKVLDAVRFYVPSSATYDDLIATGQIKLIKSDSLRYWLMAYGLWLMAYGLWLITKK